MSLEDVRTITVLGAGSMGHGIAEVAALAGYDVTLRDINEEFVQNGYEQIRWSVERLADRGHVDEAPEAVLERITPVVDLPTSLEDADVVIEAVPEKLSLKKDVYGDVSRHAPPEAVFATNTSTISITELSEATDRPEQFCGMHFFNPPVRMQLVEVISGKHTAEETLETIEELSKAFGKTPVRVRKDSPGFIVNRVLVPMLNEAAWLVHTDEASIAEVDSSAKYGLGLPMGCFELADQIGIDVILDVIEYMHNTLGHGYEPCPLFVEQVDAGNHGKKTGRGFYDWEADGADVPTDAQRTDVERTLLAVGINETAKLVADDVASPSEIDEAVMLGAGFPSGPTGLASDVGYDELVAVLETRQEATGAPRYEPAPFLETWADPDESEAPFR